MISDAKYGPLSGMLQAGPKKNDSFPKFRALYCSLNMESLTKIS